MNDEKIRAQLSVIQSICAKENTLEKEKFQKSIKRNYKKLLARWHEHVIKQSSVDVDLFKHSLTSLFSISTTDTDYPDDLVVDVWKMFELELFLAESAKIPKAGVALPLIITFAQSLLKSEQTDNILELGIKLSQLYMETSSPIILFILSYMLNCKSNHEVARSIIDGPLSECINCLGEHDIVTLDIINTMENSDPIFYVWGKSSSRFIRDFYRWAIMNDEKEILRYMLSRITKPLANGISFVFEFYSLKQIPLQTTMLEITIFLIKAESLPNVLVSIVNAYCSGGQLLQKYKSESQRLIKALANSILTIDEKDGDFVLAAWFKLCQHLSIDLTPKSLFWLCIAAMGKALRLLNPEKSLFDLVACFDFVCETCNVLLSTLIEDVDKSCLNHFLSFLYYSLSIRLIRINAKLPITFFEPSFLRYFCREIYKHQLTPNSYLLCRNYYRIIKVLSRESNWLLKLCSDHSIVPYMMECLKEIISVPDLPSSTFQELTEAILAFLRAWAQSYMKPDNSIIDYAITVMRLIMTNNGGSNNELINIDCFTILKSICATLQSSEIIFANRNFMFSILYTFAPCRLQFFSQLVESYLGHFEAPTIFLVISTICSVRRRGNLSFNRYCLNLFNAIGSSVEYKHRHNFHSIFYDILCSKTSRALLYECKLRFLADEFDEHELKQFTSVLQCIGMRCEIGKLVSKPYQPIPIPSTLTASFVTILHAETGKEFVTDRYTLLALSPVIRAMLEGNFREAGQESISIYDCSDEAVELFIIYLENKLLPETKNMYNLWKIIELLGIADVYLIEDLATRCVLWLNNLVSNKFIITEYEDFKDFYVWLCHKRDYQDESLIALKLEDFVWPDLIIRLLLFAPEMMNDFDKGDFSAFLDDIEQLLLKSII